MASEFEVPAGTVVMETAVDMKGVERDLKKLDRMGVEAGKRAGEGFSGGFGEGADQASQSADGLRERLKRLSEGAKQAERDMESADEKVDEFSESAETAGKSGAGLAAILGSKLATGARKALSGVVGLAEIGVDLLAQGMGNLGRQLQERSDEMEHFGAVAEGTGRILEGTAHAVEQVARSLTILRFTIGAVILGTMAKGVREAQRFQETFAAIDNLIPQSGDALNHLRTEISELSAETGVAAEVINQTYLKALQRMPRLAQDSEKALKLVRTAIEAHSTGFTDAKTAVEAYEAVLQGFNLEAEEAESISDKLFRTQQLAGTQFDRIAASVGDVASLTDALGGEFEDLLGIYATLVPTGQSVAQVNTQVRAAIQGIINPTDQAREAAKKYGVDLSAAAVRAKGLNTVLAEIIEVAEGQPEVIAEMFGRQEAVTLLVTLADRLDTLRERTEQVSNASGTHQDVVEDLNERVSRQVELLKQDWIDSLRQLGFTLRDVFDQPILLAIKAAGLLTDGLTAVFNAVGDVIRVVDSLEDAFEQIVTVSFWRKIINGDFRGALDQISDELQEIRDIRSGIEETLGRPGFTAGGRRIGGGPDVGERFARREAVARELNRQIQEMVAEGMRWTEAVKEAREAIERQRPIERPALPTSPEFSEDRIREMKRAGQVRAALADTEEEYQEILHQTQLRVNRLVKAEVARLRQAGVEEEQLATLTSMYDRQAAQLERTRDAYRSLADLPKGVLSELFMEGLDEDLGAQISRRMEELTPEIDLGGVRQRVMAAVRELDDVLSDTSLTAEERMKAVVEVMDRFGITVEDLRDAGMGAFADMTAEATRFEKKQEELDEDTKKLIDDLDQFASVARGIIDVADAMGELDSETRQTLQSVVSLAEAGKQIASGNILSGVVQGAGALANILSSAFGEDPRIAEERNELVNQLEELNQNFGELAAALRGVPGDIIAGFQEVMSGLDLTGEEAEGLDLARGVTGDVEDLRRRMDALGLTVSDLERLADSLGISLDALIKALKGGEVSAEELRDELHALQQAMNEVALTRLFETFRGQMEMLRLELELFDIDDPVEKLERMRSLFLEFVDLPAELEKELAAIDLSTEEGRQRFQALLQEIFRQLQAGEIEAAELGELSLDEFLRQLQELESTAEEASRAGEDGTTESFQIFRGVTEVTANRLEGTLISLSITAEKQLAELVAIRQAVAGDSGGPPSTNHVPAPPPPSAVEGGTTVHRSGDLSVSVGPIHVEGGVEEPERVARQISDATVRELDRRLGRLQQDRRRSQGRI